MSPGGLVLTAAHVVPDGAETVAVELPTAEKLTAKVVRINRDRDVALLRLPEGRYTAIPVGTVSSLRVGSPVFAIGTPLDARLARTVTKGVVSALRMDGAQRFIQERRRGACRQQRRAIARRGRPRGRHHDVRHFARARRRHRIEHFVPIDEAWSALNASPSPTSVNAGDLMVRPAQR
ncbi:MAG: trypsin-like peptidase domain-containing protein [Candidatus Rokubacteria bacterium]|nr:trypsin-like peptidase domain-containing protein [Candidatus Rokubacteria bacterium]